MARPKTYIIKLSDDERAALQKTIRNKKTCKTVSRFIIYLFIVYLLRPSRSIG